MSVTVVPGRRPRPFTDERTTVVVMGDRIPTRAEELAGQGTQSVGDATGDQNLEADGQKAEGTADLDDAEDKTVNVSTN